MEKSPTHILFDLDGTLTDPAEGITNSYMHALKQFGIEVRERSELYKVIGPPLMDSFQEFYGFTPEQARLGMKLYREYFVPKGMFENKVYDGIPQLLKNLLAAGKKLYVATSKPEPFSIKILEHFNLAEYFTFIGGSDLEETRVNKADVIHYVLEENGLLGKEDQCIMIGDRKHDILGAKQNNLKSIGVLFGYGSRQELEEAGADLIAETPGGLLEPLTTDNSTFKIS